MEKEQKDKEYKFVRPDCAGFVGLEMGNRCLKLGKCTCFECKSFQSKEDYRETLKKCRKRLRSLPMAEQELIAEKYYHGIKEWWNKEETE